MLAGGGRGIPHPLHSEGAFQKSLQAPVGTRKVTWGNGWLAPATRERLPLLRGDVTWELWAGAQLSLKQEAWGARAERARRSLEAARETTALLSPSRGAGGRGWGMGPKQPQAQLSPSRLLPTTDRSCHSRGLLLTPQWPQGPGVHRPAHRQALNDTMFSSGWDSVFDMTETSPVWIAFPQTQLDGIFRGLGRQSQDTGVQQEDKVPRSSALGLWGPPSWLHTRDPCPQMLEGEARAPLRVGPCETPGVA